MKTEAETAQIDPSFSRERLGSLSSKMYSIILKLFFLSIFFPLSLTRSSVFEEGAIMVQILLEKPGRDFCVQKDFKEKQYIDAFAYAVRAQDYEVELELSLANESGHVIDHKQPQPMQVEAQGRAMQAGLYTLCVKTALASNRPNVKVMLGIFILSAAGNDTDTDSDGPEPVKLDESFGVLQIENLTHVATRVMLAITTSHNFIQESSLYLTQDTSNVQYTMSLITKWSLVVSAALILCTVVQVHVLKSFFKTRISI